MLEQTSSSTPVRILVVDDDQELCELLIEYLSRERFEVTATPTGDEGLRLLDRHDLVVLDVMLPTVDGFEVLRRIRSRSSIPVIMLTAKGDEVDRILGLELGADDYLPKPFNPRELLARIHAVLRRGRRRQEQKSVLEVGDVRLDPATRMVWRAGEPVALTTAEFDLLEILLRSAGSPLSRDELCEAALRRPLHPYDRSIDMLVSQLRRKLGWKIGDLERIKTIRGVGYMYTLPTEVAVES
ncbi:MAG: two-component system response regulator MisR [Acidobacteriota bacterium]